MPGSQFVPRISQARTNTIHVLHAFLFSQSIPVPNTSSPRHSISRAAKLAGKASERYREQHQQAANALHARCSVQKIGSASRFLVECCLVEVAAGRQKRRRLSALCREIHVLKTVIAA
jgi:hypothetical protein